MPSPRRAAAEPPDPMPKSAKSIGSRFTRPEEGGERAEASPPVASPPPPRVAPSFPVSFPSVSIGDEPSASATLAAASAGSPLTPAPASVVVVAPSPTA